MYLTYAEYKNYGGTLDETTFNEYAFEAEVQINWYTFNRLENDTVFDEKVKRCMYKLINIIQSKQIASAMPSDTGESLTGMQASVASQSNDGVSISYNVLSASDIVQQSKDEIKNTVLMSLSGVRNEAGKRITWRGIYPDE